MIKSLCHKAPVWVYSGDEGTSYYVCTKCNRAYDTIYDDKHHGDIYDAGSEVETKTVIGATCKI